MGVRLRRLLIFKMKIIKNKELYLLPKDLHFCNDVFEKQGFIFYRTTFGNLLQAIRSKDKNKSSLTITYDVKLSLFERLFGWEGKKLNIIREQEK